MRPIALRPSRNHFHARSTGMRATTKHFHAWNVAATESDEFGSVRLYECTCGAARYDACA